MSYQITLREKMLDAVVKEKAGVQVCFKNRFFSGVLGKDSHGFFYLLNRSDERFFFRPKDIICMNCNNTIGVMIYLDNKINYWGSMLDASIKRQVERYQMGL